MGTVLRDTISFGNWIIRTVPMILLWVGCSHQERMDDENSVYYWRTEWRLDSTERAFLKQYHIHKVFCRYFDVMPDESGEPMPNATIAFTEKSLRDWNWCLRFSLRKTVCTSVMKGWHVNWWNASCR